MEPVLTQSKKSVLRSPFVIQLLLIMFGVEFVKGALLISVLPVYMETALGLSAYVIGWALACQYIGDNVLRSPLGFIIDRIGYRLVMLTGVLLTLLSVIIMAVSDQPGWLLLACALLGLGTSPLWPCVITGATAVSGQEASGIIMSVVYMAWLTGVGCGPIVINFFIIQSFTPAFNLLLVFMAVVLIVALFLPGRTRKAAAAAGTVRTAEMHANEFMKEAGAAAEEDKPQRRSALRRAAAYLERVGRTVRASKLLYPAMFAQTFALGLLIPVLTLFARNVLHLSPQEYSLYLTAGGAVTVLGLIPVGKWVDRVGTARFLHAGFLVTAVSLPVLGFVRDAKLALVVVAVIGLGYACIIPAWNALIAYAIPEEERGAVWGFFLTIEGSGTVLGSVLSGKMWDYLGPHAPFMISGFVLFILFVLHLFISHRRPVVVR
ncbi:MFS transporter [Paenibacillus sambharensis]|uniref:MFS transporter n=1 Tax=Paenibacillus sambharensis TaxID=1803190 RepID=A0A2W1LHA2_9BACL|nr:MFS transporter [Paenibacillus sambharensis]PZD93844.1 MFS transporter [Paenibacillus sambharensis]